GAGEPVLPGPIGSRLRVLLLTPAQGGMPVAGLQNDFDVTVESEVAAAVERCERAAFDVIVVDHEPVDAGIDVLRNVLRLRPEALRVLVLPSEDTFVEVRGTTLARVDCFLLRTEAPEAVSQAVRHALMRREV